MDLVLNEEVNQWHKGREETAGKNLTVLERSSILRTEGNAADCPWQSCDEVGDHKDVVPVMVIGRGDICPSSAGECSKDTNASDELGEGRVWATGQDVPKADKSESGT